jgi:hypothetical protein
MDRRGFLRTTFQGGLATGATACAAERSHVSEAPRHVGDAPLSDTEINRRLHRIDRTFDRMDRVSDQWFLGHRKRASGVADEPRSVAQAEQLASEGELLRASMRSIFMTSSLAELPASQHADPRVVERLRRVSGEADFAVFGTLARLESLDAQQLSTLDEAAKQPDFIDRVLEDIDDLSSELEVPASRRLHLRRLAKHLSWKLERQSMSAIIRETVDAVAVEIETWSRRLQSAGPELALASADPRWIARTQDVVQMYAKQVTPEQPQTVEQLRASQVERAELRVRQGQIMLGVGLGLALLGGGGVIAGVYTLSPLIWVGGVAATIGVILVIVGAVFWGLGNRSLKDLGAR